MEDFNKLRLLAKQLIQTDFRLGWQFRMEITSTHATLSPPTDFDIFVKDVTYDPIEIETEDEKIGGHTFTWPTATAPVTISMTMRDNKDHVIRKWFQSLTDTIVDKDGTIKLVKDIDVEVRRYALNPDGTDQGTEVDMWKAIPKKLGEITESRSESGTIIEFPITFIQHSTVK